MRTHGMMVVITLALSLTASGQESRNNFSGVINGQVLNLEGSAVPRADVFALECGIRQTGRIPRTRADEKGRFSLGVEKPGRYTITASKEDEGYALNAMFPAYGTPAVPFPEIDVDEQHLKQSVVVTIGPKAGRMCGRVVDAESNQVVESGTVLLRQTFSESTAFVMEVPYTRGRFQLAVPPGLFSLTVSASGYHVWYGNGSKSQPELFAVEIGDQEEITVRLQSLTSR